MEFFEKLKDSFQKLMDNLKGDWGQEGIGGILGNFISALFGGGFGMDKDDDIAGRPKEIRRGKDIHNENDPQATAHDNGVVVKITEPFLQYEGQSVVMRHGQGDDAVYTVYTNLEHTDLAVGETVAAGDDIGLTTENSQREIMVRAQDGQLYNIDWRYSMEQLHSEEVNDDGRTPREEALSEINASFHSAFSSYLPPATDKKFAGKENRVAASEQNENAQNGGLDKVNSISAYASANFSGERLDGDMTAPQIKPEERPDFDKKPILEVKV